MVQGPHPAPPRTTVRPVRPADALPQPVDAQARGFSREAVEARRARRREQADRPGAQIASGRADRVRAARRPRHEARRSPRGIGPRCSARAGAAGAPSRCTETSGSHRGRELAARATADLRPSPSKGPSVSDLTRDPSEVLRSGMRGIRPRCSAWARTPRTDVTARRDTTCRRPPGSRHSCRAIVRRRPRPGRRSSRRPLPDGAGAARRREAVASRCRLR